MKMILWKLKETRLMNIIRIKVMKMKRCSYAVDFKCKVYFKII